MRRLALLAPLLLLALPQAAALGAYPQEARAGPAELRLLLRAAEGTLVRVEADGPVEVALVPPGAQPAALVPAPADLRAPAGSWHGLAGVVELVARRADPGQAVLLSASEGDAGVAYEWGEARVSRVAFPAPALAVAAALLAWACVSWGRKTATTLRGGASPLRTASGAAGSA